MKFDFCIGNPPFMETTESESTRMPPLYHRFMDEAYKVANKVELITPARFLFNGGYTPKDWNKKMLNDSHFKTINYFPNSQDVFPNMDIMGGIVISYYDKKKEFEPIKIFTFSNTLTSILKKVQSRDSTSLKEMVFPALSYKLTDKMKKENPDSLHRLRTSAFKKLEEIFYPIKPEDDLNYIVLLGLLNNKRTKRFVRRDYINSPDNLDNYKVFIPKSNGSGALGETIPTNLIGNPEIGQPGEGHTQSFISIGNFNTLEEAQNCLKYIKTKFMRVMLGILKITQDNPPEKWKFVPVQDFTLESDIDWSKSIAEIDQQLYEKYGLNKDEIDFIETHVKEME